MFNELSKHKAKSYLQSIIYPKTKGFFRDDTWKPVQSILKDLSDNGIDYNIQKTDYYHIPNSEHSPMPDGKKWYVEIPHGDKGGFLLYINASFGPSKPQENDVYDLVATIEYSSSIRASKKAGAEDLSQKLVKLRQAVFIIQNVIRAFNQGKENNSDLAKLKSEAEKYKTKAEKDIESQKDKFNSSKTPPKDLSDLVKKFQSLVKENITRGSGLDFDVKYRNYARQNPMNYSIDVKSGAVINIKGQKPLFASIVMTFTEGLPYYQFSLGEGNHDNVKELFFEDKSTLQSKTDNLFQVEKLQRMLVDGGYKKLKNKTEENQHEFRKMEDGKHIKVKESENENLITVEGYEEIDDSWKTKLYFSKSEESSLKSRIDSAVKGIKNAGGFVTGSLTYQEEDYYDGTDTYRTPRVIVKDNIVTMSSDSHHDIPKAWAVSFRFHIKFPKGKKYDTNLIKSSLQDFISAAKVLRWGNSR
jgi:hypothetical protein